jgi:rubrerythrin
MNNSKLENKIKSQINKYSSLRDKNTCANLCKYCYNGEDLINNIENECGVEVYIDKNKLLAGYSFIPAGYIGAEGKPINYCPICGRKL